jgi:hypothetical protein
MFLEALSGAKQRHQVRQQNEPQHVTGGPPPCVQAGGAEDDLFIIHFLPIYLVDMARAWLDHLPRGMIDCWEDLRVIFTANFQGTYVRSGNPWDLKGCQQKSGESLRNYIQSSLKSAMNSPRFAMLTSSQHSGLTLAAEP